MIHLNPVNNLRNNYYLFLVILTCFLSSCNLKNNDSSTMIQLSRNDTCNNTIGKFNHRDVGHFDCKYCPKIDRYSLDHTYPPPYGFSINNKYCKNNNSHICSNTNYYNTTEVVNYNPKFVPGMYLHTYNDVLYPIDNVHNILPTETTIVDNSQESQGSNKFNCFKMYHCKRDRLYSYIISKQYDKFFRECSRIERKYDPKILNCILSSRDIQDIPWSLDENFSYNILEKILYKFNSAFRKIILLNEQTEGLKKVLKYLIKKKLTIKLTIRNPLWFRTNVLYDRESNVQLIHLLMKDVIKELDNTTKLQVTSVNEYIKKHNHTLQIYLPCEIIDLITSFVPTFCDLIDKSVREY